MDYTAIGDEVNLAGRLEGLNKLFCTRIIISHSTHQLVDGYFVCRQLDQVRVKGKRRATRVYELVAERSAYSSDTFAWIEQYHAAFKLYYEGRWREAMEGFRELAEGAQKDSASATMLQRCAHLFDNPPEDWDGTFTQETKL